MFNPVAPYRYLLSNLNLSVADIAIPDLFVFGSRTWISLDIACFFMSISSHPAAPHGRLAQKKLSGTHCWGGWSRHNLHRVCQTAVTDPPRVCCVVWSQTTCILLNRKLGQVLRNESVMSMSYRIDAKLNGFTIMK